MNSIIRPVITEKSMGQANDSTFSFIVSRHAGKELIKKHVEKEFNVHVTGVSTSTIKGKVKRVGQRRMEKNVSPVKKAIVTLQKGEKISLFSLTDEK